MERASGPSRVDINSPEGLKGKKTMFHKAVKTVESRTQDFVISANGEVFGVYQGVDANAAFVAYVRDAGYDSVESAADALDKSVKEFTSGTKVELLNPLSERVSIVRATFGTDIGSNDPRPYVAFSVAVDGVVVHDTLEWLDEDRDLVSDDAHLDVGDKVWGSVIARAAHIEGMDLDDLEDEVYDVVHEKLREAVAELKERNPIA